MTLKYIGKGIIPGIPGRDLSPAEVEKHGGAEFLIGTGLWEAEKPKRKSRQKEEVTDG